MAGTRRGQRVELQVGGRTGKLISGDLSVEDLDEEELARGYCKDKNGKFTGRPPVVVPRALFQRMQRELFQRFDERLKSGLVDALDVILNLARDPDVDATNRRQAAQYVIDRVMGKTPEKVTVVAEDPWETILNGVMRDGVQAETRTLVRKMDDGH